MEKKTDESRAEVGTDIMHLSDHILNNFLGLRTTITVEVVLERFLNGRMGVEVVVIIPRKGQKAGREGRMKSRGSGKPADEVRGGRVVFLGGFGVRVSKGYVDAEQEHQETELL